MTTGLISRVLGTLENLTDAPDGLGVQTLADMRNMPKASMHRMLAELSELGYVRQNTESQKYYLTTKLISLGNRCLTSNRIADMVQSVLDGLAEESKELVRLAIVDRKNLTWVAKAQGARPGLRYDPDMGREAKLSSTATGQAWLASLADEQALEIVAAQGFGDVSEQGPNAPGNAVQFLECLKETRSRGYAAVFDSAAIGTSAMAAPVPRPGTKTIVATVSIAGPSARLTEDRMNALSPALFAAVEELSERCQYSEFLNI